MARLSSALTYQRERYFTAGFGDTPASILVSSLSTQRSFQNDSEILNSIQRLALSSHLSGTSKPRGIKTNATV